MKTPLTVAALFWACTGLAQSKMAIDEELLSELVSSKQEEVRDRVLGNLVTKSVRTTNYTTYNTLYYMVDILLTEKNKSAMAQGLVKEMVEYGVTYAATEHFLRTKFNAVSVNSEELKLREVRGAVVVSTLDMKQIFQRILPTFDEQAERRVPKLDKSGKPTGKSWVPPARMRVNGTEKDAGVKLAIGNITKYSSTADDEIMNADADAQLVFVNWLMDTMWHCLNTEKKFHDLGIFSNDPQRQRFDAGSARFKIDYNSFWEKRKNAPSAIDPADRRLVGQAVATYVRAMAALLTQAEDIGTKLGTTITGLAGLDLKDMGTLSEQHLQGIVTIFKTAVEVFRERRGNHAVAKLCDVLTKYIVIDPEFGKKKDEKELRFIIDVEAIILDIEEEFTGLSVSTLRNNWVGVKPFFTIGLNYGFFNNFSNEFATEDRLGLQEVGWAGEKIGVKVLFWDWGYTRSHRPKELFKYRGSYRRWLTAPAKPIINNAFLMVYGSGLLYGIADLRTDAEFDSPIVGAGGGVEFFNGMGLNLTYAVPLPPSTSLDEKLNSAFVNVGFDVPIFEYIRAARAKRGK